MKLVDVNRMNTKENFFIKDRSFYKTLAILILTVAGQNLIAYSVNMLDNIMLGSYSQAALSGAATVNQIFFMVQQTALSIGSALVTVASQYWGKKQMDPIRRITWIAMKFNLLAAVVALILCAAVPMQLLSLFTTSSEIIQQGAEYLKILKWSFVFFMISNLFISMLRSVEIVRIALVTSIVSLIVNGGINYTLIFGKFGFPEMGIRGAAIGTLIARAVELGIVLVYVAKIEHRVRFFEIFKKSGSERAGNKEFRQTFTKVCTPILVSSMIWAISVPMQTAILGHLSDDAIAANSVATTFFQYLKVIVVAMASASAVMIGKSIGEGEKAKVRAAGRTLSVIDVGIGVVLAIILYLLRNPLLSFYQLTDTARVLAEHFMIIMSFVMVAMSYQMPVSVGVLQGSGDANFCMRLNMISIWVIVMPLSFLSAFVWKLPVELVVLAVQSDQFFKGIPIFFRFRSYRWIHELTK